VILYSGIIGSMSLLKRFEVTDVRGFKELYLGLANGKSVLSAEA